MTHPSAPLDVRAVVFDMDGLMFNTEELYEEVDREVLRRRGRRPPPALFDEMMGRPTREALEILIARCGLEATVDELQREIDALFEGVLPRRLAPLPGLLPLLDALEAAGLPKAVATSSRRWFLDAVMRLSGLGPRFAFMLTSEDVERGKPHPEIYQRAAARLGVPPEQVVVLEDSQIGCRAAAAAGTVVIAVPGPHSRHHAFPNVRLIADSLEDPRLYELLGLPASPDGRGGR